MIQEIGKYIKITELKISWLVANKYLVLIPKDIVVRKKLLKALYVLCNNDYSKVSDIATGISRTSIFTSSKSDFVLSASKAYRLKQEFNKVFNIPILDEKGKKSGHTLTFRISDVEKLVPNTNKLSINKALEIRKQETDKTYINPGTIEEREKLAFEVCQMFASGRYLLRECCEKHNVDIMNFIEWLVSSQTIQQIYNESVQISKFIVDSDLVSLSAQMIIKRLQTGQTVTTQKLYRTKEDKKGNPILTEKSRSETIKEISIRDLISLIAIVRDVKIDGLPEKEAFTGMTIDELKNSIKEMEKNIEGYTIN